MPLSNSSSGWFFTWTLLNQESIFWAKKNNRSLRPEKKTDRHVPGPTCLPSSLPQGLLKILQGPQHKAYTTGSIQGIQIPWCTVHPCWLFHSRSCFPSCSHLRCWIWSILLALQQLLWREVQKLQHPECFKCTPTTGNVCNFGSLENEYVSASLRRLLCRDDHSSSWDYLM